MYTIGQVSEMFGLPVSTLRYYDKEGLFPQMERTSGMRRFGEREIEALRVIECLKRSGLEIRDIKRFMDWCMEGSSTYPQRLELPAPRPATGAKRAAGGRDQPDGKGPGHAALQVLVLHGGDARRKRGPPRPDAAQGHA